MWGKKSEQNLPKRARTLTLNHFGGSSRPGVSRRDSQDACTSCTLLSMPGRRLERAFPSRGQSKHGGHTPFLAARLRACAGTTCLGLRSLSSSPKTLPSSEVLHGHWPGPAPSQETGSPFSRRKNLCLCHSQPASPTVRTSDTLRATFLGVMLPTGGGVPFDVALSCMNSFLWSPPRWTQPECQMVISSRPGCVPADIIIRLLGFQSEQPT